MNATNWGGFRYVWQKQIKTARRRIDLVRRLCYPKSKMLAAKIIISLVLFGFVIWFIAGDLFAYTFDDWGAMAPVAVIGTAVMVLICLVYVVGKIISGHRD